MGRKEGSSAAFEIFIEINDESEAGQAVLVMVVDVLAVFFDTRTRPSSVNMGTVDVAPVVLVDAEALVKTADLFAFILLR